MNKNIRISTPFQFLHLSLQRYKNKECLVICFLAVNNGCKYNLVYTNSSGHSFKKEVLYFLYTGE